MRNQRGYMSDGMAAVVGVVGAVAIVGAVVMAGWFVEAVTCNKKASMMGLRDKYSPWTGCMVQVGDRYAPINYIRIVDNKVIIQGDGEE